jgi:hypothetical protein
MNDAVDVERLEFLGSAIGTLFDQTPTGRLLRRSAQPEARPPCSQRSSGETDIQRKLGEFAQLSEQKWNAETNPVA